MKNAKEQGLKSYENQLSRRDMILLEKAYDIPER